MIRKCGLLLAGVLLMSGCDDSVPFPKEFSLICGNYDVFIEMTDADTLNTAVNGEKIRMFRAVSASGVRYEGKGAIVSASLWNKGESWQLSLDKTGYILCKTSTKTRRR